MTGFESFALIMGAYLTCGYLSWRRYLVTTKDSKATRESPGGFFAFLFAWPMGWAIEPGMFGKLNGKTWLQNHVRKIRKED